MDEKRPDSSRVSMAQVQAVLEKILLPTPRPWLVILGIAIILSVLDVTRTAEGKFAITFHLTSVTVLLVALVWLPFLLKVIAISGGGVKTAAGEASILGLEQLLSRLDPGTQREALSTYVTIVEAAQSRSPEVDQPRLRELREDLEHQLASLSPESQHAREQLKAFAKLYEATRNSMPPGPDRTFKMSTIVAQARAIASQAKYEPLEVSDLFAENTSGSRIVALAILQASPDPTFFSLAREAIGKSRSAFEQYHALRAVEGMVGALSPDQKRELDATLRDQRSGGPDKYIKPDSDRWTLSSRILNALK